ncbi:dnaJ homolog subfamily C member 5G isoform 2-T2 [Thomomys bottae]
MSHVEEAARQLSKQGSTLYAVLEVKKGASLKEIKRAYRRLALKYHPDKNPDNPQAAEIFKEINTAHAILSDPKKREIYDQHGSLGIYLYDHFGDNGVRYYFTVHSCWFKTLVVLCTLLTCCCCCCCCCFCCGTLTPPSEEDNRQYPPHVHTEPPGEDQRPWLRPEGKAEMLEEIVIAMITNGIQSRVRCWPSGSALCCPTRTLGTLKRSKEL